MLADCFTKNQPLYWVCLISQWEQNSYISGGRDAGKGWKEGSRDMGRESPDTTTQRVSPGKTLLLGWEGWSGEMAYPDLYRLLGFSLTAPVLVVAAWQALCISM